MFSLSRVIRRTLITSSSLSSLSYFTTILISSLSKTKTKTLSSCLPSTRIKQRQIFFIQLVNCKEEEQQRRQRRLIHTSSKTNNNNNNKDERNLPQHQPQRLIQTWTSLISSRGGGGGSSGAGKQGFCSKTSNGDDKQQEQQQQELLQEHLLLLNRLQQFISSLEEELKAMDIDINHDTNTKQAQQQQRQSFLESFCYDYVQLEPIMHKSKDYNKDYCSRTQIVEYLALTKSSLVATKTTDDKVISLFLDYLQQAIPKRRRTLENPHNRNHVLTFLVQLRHDIQQVLKQHNQQQQQQQQKQKPQQEESNECDAELILQSLLMRLSERITEIIQSQMITTTMILEDDNEETPSSNLLQVYQIKAPPSASASPDTPTTTTPTTPKLVLQRLVSTDYVHPISSVDELLQTRIKDPQSLPTMPLPRSQTQPISNLTLLKRRVHSLMHHSIPLLPVPLEGNDNDVCDSQHDGNNDNDNDKDASLLLEPLVVVHAALTTSLTATATNTTSTTASAAVAPDDDDDSTATAIPSKMSQLFPKQIDTNNEGDNDNMIHQQTQAREPTVATFYSISNTQPGLAGFGLGKVLLERAIQMLQEEFPTLDTFVTLSPVPTFRTWLETTIVQEQQRQRQQQQRKEVNMEKDDTTSLDDDGDDDDDYGTIPLLSQEDYEHLVGSGLIPTERIIADNSTMARLEALTKLLERLDQEYIQQQEEELQKTRSNNDNHTFADVAVLWETYGDVLGPIFKKLVARYILLETKTSASSNKIRPYDGVARFHLGNGAQLYRINLAANLFPGNASSGANQLSYHNPNSSRLSWMQSWGIMVNYRYQLSTITKNQEHCNQEHANTKTEGLAQGSTHHHHHHHRIPVSHHIVPWFPTNLAAASMWLQCHTQL